MLGAIEVDSNLNNDDTVKYSVIALANLSSHPKFMADSDRTKGDLTQMSKVCVLPRRPAPTRHEAGV